MLFVLAGSLFGLLGVAYGAFGAHMLKPRLEADLFDIFQTAVQYQMYHAFALLAVGILMRQIGGGTQLAASGWLFVAGILIFSGSLYVLSLSGIRTFGAITPIGGVAFIAGWMMLGLAVWRHWN